ncbi:HTTM domain-containing protein [Reichenbachiella sp. 5M10]|uniref:HTTM domain-containing protein n=1 Tax=Reichenbachiella sp. 5M10 TaxID=1889772 RepID=UPI00210144DD|nr:HTTM domain-containing protein [Reichenbachiella sp. 5M10]
MSRKSEAAPLAVFRVLFGLMMVWSVIRFWYNGWIQKLYLAPTFHFNYYGFEWVQPIGLWTYLLFVLCGLSALAVTLGYHYRIAIVVFFLSFTYIELMDKTTYLNHYYFVSLVSFLMIFLPAHVYFSLDAKRNPDRACQYIPQWTIDVIKLMLCIVYFYAGLAKLNSDWLLDAMPLKIWLPSKYDIPIIGGLLQYTWTHYAFSWGGALYDLSIPFLMLFRRTRGVGFAMIVGFHLLTRVLFPIGMFPYLMIASALIFFDSTRLHCAVTRVSHWLRIDMSQFDNHRYYQESTISIQKAKIALFSVFFVLQLLLPFRYLMYPGELFWTQEGFRFSWRVMLVESAGSAMFKVVDLQSGKRFYVDNANFLTPFQEKQMAFQPDFILEYAHRLEAYYEEIEGKELAVYVDCFVAMNGRLSQRYIDPQVDLTKIEESFRHKDWILPMKDEIEGL